MQRDYIPSGNQVFINSPMILPKAAPTLKTGTKHPQGTGSVVQIIAMKYCREISQKINPLRSIGGTTHIVGYECW